MSPKEVTLRDYIDLRINGVEDKLNSQMQFFIQHFELTALALEKSEKDAAIRKESRDLILKTMEVRMQNLETTNSFSAGKMWMVMAGFAAIPTILALVAFFRSM